MRGGERGGEEVGKRVRRRGGRRSRGGELKWVWVEGRVEREGDWRWGGIDIVRGLQCTVLRRNAESQTCNGTRSRVPRESAFNINRPPKCEPDCNAKFPVRMLVEGQCACV